MTGTSDGTVDTCAGINFVPFFVEAFRCGPFFPDVEGFSTFSQLCEIEL